MPPSLMGKEKARRRSALVGLVIASGAGQRAALEELRHALSILRAAAARKAVVSRRLRGERVPVPRPGAAQPGSALVRVGEAPVRTGHSSKWRGTRFPREPPFLRAAPAPPRPPGGQSRLWRFDRGVS